MKAYIATVEIEMPIYAENEDEAASVAVKFIDQEIDAMGRFHETDFSIKPMKRCPIGMCLFDSCWSSKDNETVNIQEGIKLNDS
jgi:hypothetical protein